MRIEGRLQRSIALGVVVWTLGMPPVALAESDGEIRERLQSLEQEVAILKRQLEVKQEADDSKAKSAAVAAAGPDGFYLRSPDKKYQIKVRGYIQTDGRFFEEGQQNDSVGTFVVRRVRPIVEGTLGEYPPVGLERLQSVTSLMFVERAFPTQLVPSRDIGAQLAGDFGSGLFSSQVGVFNGVRDSGNNLDTDTNGGKDRPDEGAIHSRLQVAYREGVGR